MRTIWWEKGRVLLINQKKLPETLEYVECHDFQRVAKAIKTHKAVYFLTYSGCGALLSKYVKKMKPIAYKNLGPEAIYELEVKDFPLIVEIDSQGGRLYD